MLGSVMPMSGGGERIDVTFGSADIGWMWAILGVALIALVFAYWLVRQVLRAPEGSSRMKEIAKAIQEGAQAYLSRQFRTVAVFIVLIGVVIFFALPVVTTIDPATGAPVHSELVIRLGRSLAFVMGAGFSAITGYAGMWLAVRANVRTANAAKQTGVRGAMRIAFRAGGVAGMFTVGLGLLGAVIILIVFQSDAAGVLVGFGFGGALLAMFMRVGGGIFTKAADVGADLVGKVEKNIPEDDPRNAATIADNVGDNVGDCAGMAADLFESYEVTLVAALILGTAAFANDPKMAVAGVMFPLFVRAIGVITSIIGILCVNPRTEDEHGMKSINRGFFISAAVSAVAVGGLSIGYMGTWKPAIAVFLGLVLAAVIQILTQYFTDTKYRPVRDVAKSTRTGPATTILSGFTIGLESTVWAILIVAGVIYAAFLLADQSGPHHVQEALYYIALTGMGMLTTVGVIVSMDTYGPISDNAQGIAEMSGEFGGKPAQVLNNLDAVGNSTKAITKGVAIATAVIAATSMFGSFETELTAAGFNFTGIDVSIPSVLAGLLIGGSIAFLFSSLAIGAVSRAAARVVFEVRQQFRNHPGIMDYSEKPDYARVVDICTKTSLRELLTPGLLAVLSPVAVGFLLGPESLGGFLAGSILTGQLLAVMLSNSGGAWDNAKKYIEDGHYGGKGSDEHKASIIGDTVGDPFKDTAGPSLNPLIKVMNLVAVLIAPAIVAIKTAGGVWGALIAVACVAIIGLAIWRSKSRRDDDLMDAPLDGPDGGSDYEGTGTGADRLMPAGSES